LATLAGAQAPPAFAQTGAATAGAENPAITSLARAQLDALRAGKVDRNQYTAAVNARFTDDEVSQAARLLTSGGSVKTFAYAGTAVEEGVHVSQYTVEFEHPISVPMMPTTADWVESIATDKDGKISFIAFEPKK